MSTLTEIAEQIARLQSSGAVEVIKSDDRLEPEEKLGALKELVAEDRIKYPECVLELTRIGEALRAYWRSVEAIEGEQVLGEFLLQTPLRFGPDSTLPDTFQDMKFGALQLRDTRVLDWYGYNGGPVHALLRVIDQRLDDKVWIFDERNLFESELVCSDYLRELARTKGVFYWQYLYCKDRRLQPFEVAALERGLSFLESAFQENCDDLRKRLAASPRSP